MKFSASLAVDLELPAIPADSGLLYELIVFPFPRAQFWVHELTGREALSELFHFDVTVSTEDILDGVLERALIGQRATLIIRAGTVPRIVRGVVAEITVVRRHPVHNRTQYRIRIVPRLWLLSLKRRTRIFQHLRVDTIVTQVLTEAGIAAHWLLEHDYPQRVYCTQYEETDLDFITRLLAEAGIYFHIANPPKAVLSALAALSSLGPPAGGPLGPALSVAASVAVDALFGSETIIFSDGPLGYSPLDDGSWLGELANMVGLPAGFSADIGIGDLSVGLPSPKLSYLSVEGTTAAAHDKVTHFEATREVQTTSATYREYDPERPDALLMRSEGHAGLKDTLADMVDADVSIGTDGVSADASLDIAGTLLAAALQALSGLPDLEYYDHHGPFLFPDWRWGSTEPARILRQKRRNRHHARGRSLVPVMHVGHRFALEDHPLGHLDIDYAVTAVRHHGRATTYDTQVVYENEFECVPTTTTFCPPRPERRTVNVVLTAAVVGPIGQEIYTDELGQIKVQFHWDREGGKNEHSSCWLRTMQTWGGTGWGTQFIPRIGMEVIVVFEGGDPDKPICLGCLNNGTHLPTFPTPENKTRSGFRTQSTPSAIGFNELSFEDKADKEQIYLQAQRDFDEYVKNNHTLRVDADETIRINGNRDDRIKGNFTFHIDGKRIEQTLGDAEFSIEKNRIDTVSGNSDERVSGMLTKRVEGKEQFYVKGNATHEYADDLTLRVKGNETVLVGRHEAERSYQLHVEGVARIHGTKALELSTDKELIFRCGKSMIRIGGDKVEIDAPAIAVKGDVATMSLSEAGLSMSSKTARADIKDGTVAMSTDGGATFAMGKEVKIDAKQILLNSPDRPAEDPPPADPGPPTKIKLTDQDGHPLPHQRYLILLEDGTEHSGLTDKDGQVELDLPEDGKIFFPELSEVQPG